HRRRLRLFQHPDYFLFTEPTSLHFLLLLLLEQNYTFQLSSFWGSGQCPWLWPAQKFHRSEQYSTTKNRSRHTVVRSKEVATAR
ncbi:MAG TPA: hypothetical protein VN952_07875, partial [Chthoniobacterales bacterium]|nr:hypothetical protein [Chthoniobacterales bacterium]